MRKLILNFFYYRKYLSRGTKGIPQYPHSYGHIPFHQYKVYV